MNPDRDLSDLFQEQRSAEARRAPAFVRVMAQRSRPQRRALLPALAGSLAVVAVVAVWRLTGNPAAPYELRAGDLRVPTDYLLELVTVPRAGEIPRVGVVDWYPLESAPNNRRIQ
ncbi:MAG: hypothetical protein ACT4P6_19165 [Gemmatimonadaceae bacterium]